jgi:hypothetical protein
MKRTYSQRQHNRYELVRLRLVDCYGAATVYKMTHAQLLKRISEVVWESNDYKRLSQTYRAMLSECARCLSDANYRHLEWPDTGGPWPPRLEHRPSVPIGSR